MLGSGQRARGVALLAGLLVAITAAPACSLQGKPLPDLEDAHRDLSGRLPVFPGARGFGTDTRAGRGGRVIAVTTTAASGPGSLEEALHAKGPRTVVFAVGGTIRRTRDLVVSEPFVTVAGQTAPPPGITIRGAALTIATHDVLVRHLRLRAGDDPEGPPADKRDSLKILARTPAGVDAAVHGVVVDHCSIGWGVDENASTGYPGVRDVTLSFNLIHQGLERSLKGRRHSKGLLIGQHTRRIAVLRNVFAHNWDRNPKVSADNSALIANNLVYNHGRAAVSIDAQPAPGPSLVAVVANLFLPGADTRDDRPVVVDRSMPRGTRVFVAGNHRPGADDDPWALVRFAGSRAREARTDRPPVGVRPLDLWPAEELEDRLLDRVGATPAWRDAVDAQVIRSVRQRSGRVIDSPADLGSIPETKTTRHRLALPPRPDADGDGDGYTDLEEWLHAAARAAEGRAGARPGAPSGAVQGPHGAGGAESPRRFAAGEPIRAPDGPPPPDRPGLHALPARPAGRHVQ